MTLLFLVDLWGLLRMSIEIPRWSELARGGTVEQPERVSGADIKTRSIRDKSQLCLICVGSVTTCEREKLCKIGSRWLQRGEQDITSTLKSPKRIKLEKQVTSKEHKILSKTKTEDEGRL